MLKYKRLTEAFSRCVIVNFCPRFKSYIWLKHSISQVCAKTAHTAKMATAHA